MKKDPLFYRIFMYKVGIYRHVDPPPPPPPPSLTTFLSTRYCLNTCSLFNFYTSSKQILLTLSLKLKIITSQFNDSILNFILKISSRIAHNLNSILCNLIVFNLKGGGVNYRYYLQLIGLRKYKYTSTSLDPFFKICKLI